MKAGVALAARNRRFIAGVHDTDYFAKLPHEKHGHRYLAVPHNDGSTKGLWSAATEFSTLFGSETVVTREILMRFGAHLDRAIRSRPGLLDEITEAWGWKAIVSLDEHSPVAGEVPIAEVGELLYATLEWAVKQTLDRISEPDRVLSQERADALLRLVKEHLPHAETLGELYCSLIPAIYRFVAGEDVQVEATRTTELLRFNSTTCTQPRFDLLDLFLHPESASAARSAYDEAVAGSEVYPLDRFLSGAIPFDLVVPGRGRGTIRVANRAIVIMTPDPIFINLSTPVRSTKDLAQAIERKLGPNCTLIGKAITLIGMLSREFVFIFHAGASGYLNLSRRLHQSLAQAGFPLKLNPLLRLHYSAWDSIAECHSWLHLPEPLRGPFGTEDLCAPSLAGRWRVVAAEQQELLDSLASLNRPLDLIEFLGNRSVGGWQSLAAEYRVLHNDLAALAAKLDCYRQRRLKAYGKLKERKLARQAAERAMGDHFREFIFEKSPTPEHLREREKHRTQVEQAVYEIRETRHEIRDLMAQQRHIAREPEALALHDRRRAIEKEAEIKRIRLIRSAILSTHGMRRASERPSAWWFPIVCPDGGWFAETVNSARARLEDLG